MKSSNLGQLLLVGVPGLELDSETANLYRKIQPGGYILFGRNIHSASQLRNLIDDLRNLSQIEPIVTIDQEGGRVSRLKLIGNEPPNAQELRKKGDLALIREHGRLTGELLRLFAFNLDLCPVLDISFDDDADNSLRGRCYGKTVEQVIRNAAAFNDALRAAGRRIPEDLSVIAMCPDEIAEQAFPALTSISIPAHEVGRQAVALLMAKLDHREVPGATMLAPRLTIRASTRTPRTDR